MLLRLIIGLLIIVVAKILYQAIIKELKKPDTNPKPKNPEDSPPSIPMVQCHDCGAYIAKDNAIYKNSHYYCNK